MVPEHHGTEPEGLVQEQSNDLQLLVSLRPAILTKEDISFTMITMVFNPLITLVKQWFPKNKKCRELFICRWEITMIFFIQHLITKKTCSVTMAYYLTFTITMNAPFSEPPEL